jgi:hypothetical protein
LFKSWKSRAAVFTVAASMAVPALALASPAGAATGGNSTNAKACQSELRTLFRSDGTAFKNQGSCVSYAAQGGVFASDCHDANGPFGDLRIVGPTDVANNGYYYGSIDGTCSAAVIGYYTVVSSADKAGADAKCQTLTSSDAAGQLADFYPAIAPGLWYCIALNV